MSLHTMTPIMTTSTTAAGAGLCMGINITLKLGFMVSVMIGGGIVYDPSFQKAPVLGVLLDAYVPSRIS